MAKRKKRVKGERRRKTAWESYMASIRARIRELEHAGEGVKHE